jgi:hypothetical protein
MLYEMKRGGLLCLTLVVACTARNPAYQPGASRADAEGEMVLPVDAAAASPPTLNPDLSPAAPDLAPDLLARDAGPPTGLTGFYFADDTLTTLRFQRLDPNLDFAWATDPPDPRLPFLGFSVRWTGKLRTLYSESYTFTIHSSDGARMWIDGNLFIDDWKLRAPEQESIKSITLTAGSHALEVEYLHDTGWSVCRLSWESARQKKAVVPTEYLSPN